jgi:L(+)-tartrate dehydratase alpha subunit
MSNAAIDIPEDYRDGLRGMLEEEEEELSRFVLMSMLDNWEAAEADRRAMCADTGVPRYFVKIGNEARIEGGPIALERALRRATADATHSIPLRPNRVHPLSRQDNNNNVGINAPEIEYSFEPDADWIDVTTVHKGGLFGTDYRMLFPGDGIDGIKRFFLDVMYEFGRRGLACQPAIVGIGLGGSKDISVTLGKQAACLRTVGDRNPDPKIAALELELKEMGNNIGMGPMGFVGKSMVIDCHIEVGYTHTTPNGSPPICEGIQSNGRRRKRRKQRSEKSPAEDAGPGRGFAQSGDRQCRLSGRRALYGTRGPLQQTLGGEG